MDFEPGYDIIILPRRGTRPLVDLMITLVTIYGKKTKKTMKSSQKALGIGIGGEGGGGGIGGGVWGKFCILK